MKKFYLLLILLILPVMVSAKTVTCTSKNNLVEGKNVYGSISVTCDEGKINPFSICEVGSSFYYEDLGMSTCEVTNPYKAKAGKKYSYTFELILKDFGANDTLIVDGDDNWSIFARNGACYNVYDGEETGCSVTTKEHLAKSNSSNQTTTKQGETTTTTKKTTVKSTTIYWVQFDVNGGKEEIKQQGVEEGKTATKPADPTRDGYRFKEWQLDGKTYDFSTKITKSIKLKAIWNEDTTGKTNISFVKITGLLAPYEGETLDNDFRIETVKSWSTKLFEAHIEWYRGKDKNKITEQVYNFQKHKAEAGYYYQAKFILTPGVGYTLNNTKTYLGGKKVTATKEDNSLVFYSPIYGPMKKGVSAEPLIVIEDHDGTLYSGKQTKTIYHVPYLVREHDNDAEKVLLGPNCMSVSNTDYFSIDTNLCGTDKIRVDFTAVDFRPINLIFKGGNFIAGQVISTDIIITDINGKEYRGTWSFRIIKSEPIKAGKDGDPILAEFYAEAGKNWLVRAENLTNMDMGKQARAEIPVSGFTFVSLQNITVFNEEGDEQVDGTFTIKIWLDEEMRKFKDFKFVYVVGGDGYRMGAGPEEIVGHVEGEYLVAKLPHLSNYAIYGKNDGKSESKTESKKDMVKYIAIGGSAVVVIAVVAIVISKKSKK